MLQFHCSACNVIYLLQRRMPWLEDRWRTQRTVLHISKCRIPWKIGFWTHFAHLRVHIRLSEFIIQSSASVCLMDFSRWCCMQLRRDRLIWCSVFPLDVMYFGSCNRYPSLWTCNIIFCLNNLFAYSSDRMGLPAEFKHINKWRIKN